MIGYPSGQDGAILPARDYPQCPARKIPQKPYNKSFIDRACSVKMALYWPCSFMRVYGPRRSRGPLKRRKELGQYPAILTSHLVNKPFIVPVRGKYPDGSTRP